MKKLLGKLIPKVIGAYFNLAGVFNSKKIAQKAFILFCTPRKGRVLPSQKSFLTKAKDDVIDTNGIQLQTYRWPGEGATVLLMHGWESNTNRWRDLILELQKENYNIIAFDAPAHGYSTGKVLHVPLYTDCTQKIIETYCPKYIIGHSIGGMTMVYNQYKYTNSHIEKMVSLGAPSELSDFMRQYRNIIGLNKNMMTHLESYFVDIFNFKFADFSSPKFAANLQVPGLIIHDQLDAIAPICCSEQVHAAWKNSIFIQTKGLGHSLHQDQVRRQLIDFLKS